jgi:hypothetical protein
MIKTKIVVEAGTSLTNEARDVLISLAWPNGVGEFPTFTTLENGDTIWERTWPTLEKATEYTNWAATQPGVVSSEILP